MPGGMAYGDLLRRARLEKGIGQRELGRKAGLDVSYINRLETDARRPSRDTALSLAEALGISGSELDQWLIAAGHAPMTLMQQAGGAMQTSGRVRGRLENSDATAKSDIRIAADLETIGLNEAALRRLVQAMDAAEPDLREQAADALRAALAQLAQRLESQVRCAVIPAAGGQHRLLAAGVMQRLLLRVIAEAEEEGIAEIILILAPGTEGALFKPLEDAMGVAAVPSIRLNYATQMKPEGLGDAILQAEKLVRDGPFAVLLPDDFAAGNRARRKYPQALRMMMAALKKEPGSNFLAVAPVMRSKVSSYGIARLRAEKRADRVRRVEMLVEKPDPRHPICRREPIFRVAGRYLLQPGVFKALRGLKKRGAVPVELTDAIEGMRSGGQPTFAVEVKQTGEEMSRLIGRALGMMQK